MKKILKNKKVLVVILAGVLIGGYFAYGAFFSQNAATTKYITAKAARGTLVVSVTGSGQVAAQNQTNIQAQNSGIITVIAVADNQKVKKGQLLFRLDTTNDERAVRNAQVNLESAELQLQSLEQPATTSTLLQAQQSALQAQQSLQTAKNNLAADYNNGYTDVSNAFIDMPGVMTGLNDVLYGTYVNKQQADVDAYTSLISSYSASSTVYHDDAVLSYNNALTVYNQNLTDYKNTTVYSSTSTVESLLGETYGTLKYVSVAMSDAKNLLDFVQNTLQSNNKAVPSRLNTDETNIQSYITTTNSHLSTVLQVINSIQGDKQSINTENLSVAQTSAALSQLQAGPTAIQLKQQQLSVEQAQNALSDAEENLNYDYVRAPFDGVITNITAKIGQPASGALGVLVSNAQLAQATLNEVDVVNVKVGQKATVTFDALPNVSVAGTVSEVDTIGTVSQGVVSYNVQAALDTPNPDVKPGMSDTISIITKVDDNALLVPNHAVTARQGVSYVKIMGASGNPVQTEVAPGDQNDTMTQILSGLNEGDEVVTQTVTSGASTQSTGGTSGLRLGGGGGGVFFGR